MKLILSPSSSSFSSSRLLRRNCYYHRPHCIAITTTTASTATRWKNSSLMLRRGLVFSLLPSQNTSSTFLSFTSNKSKRGLSSASYSPNSIRNYCSWLPSSSSNMNMPLLYNPHILSKVNTFNPRFFSSSSSSSSSQPDPVQQVTTSSSSNKNATQPKRKPETEPEPEPDVHNPTINSNYASVTYRALVVLLITGLGLWYYLQLEKEKASKKKLDPSSSSSTTYGKPRVGGPFELINVENGARVTEAMLLDHYTLVYFGFTHCPDICPEELEKLGHVYDTLVQGGLPPTTTTTATTTTTTTTVPLQLVFITCDPARDTPDVVKAYLSEFHPALQGLTGTYEQVKEAAKQYRVYFSSPATVPEHDYLVDHSIFIYFMDKKGEFVDAFGKNLSVEQVVKRIQTHLAKDKNEMKETKVDGES